MRYLVFLLFIVVNVVAIAQTHVLEGQVADSMSGSPLPNAHISLIMDSVKIDQVTNPEGYFLFNGIKKGKYLLEIQFLAYKKYQKAIVIDRKNINLGRILLQPEDISIKEVSVIGQYTPVSQKGDTTEMSAQSYKVHVDADALDLVKKMPGITVEDGKVKAHGEELKKVLVDGKDFFGEDVALSLQNIPSDMIDKVQVYSKLSDQSEFIGFDDGNSEKVMNIITRPDRRTGQNGKFTAGYGPDNNYLLTGRWNIATKNNNLTFLGGSNNVNQQNFSMQDMFQVMRGGGPGGGNPVFMGGMNGLNTTHSVGINYSGSLSSKIKLSTSYFFNKQDNKVTEHTNKELFGNIDPILQAKFEEESKLSNNKNTNHRFNAHLEYKIDSLNSLILRQSFSFQQKDQASSINTSNFSQPTNPLLQTISENISNSTGYNYSGNLVFRHKFMKNGRTFSIGLQYSGNYQDVDNSNLSNTYSFSENIDLKQSSVSRPFGESYSANIMYTEPISQFFLLMFSYNVGISPNSSEKYVYDDAIGYHQRIDSISNAIESSYITQRAGLSILIQKDKNLNASIGMELQYAGLTGQQSFPYQNNTSEQFSDFLPNARLRYKISKKSNIMTAYRTSTQAPSTSQLQPVIDISNSTSFYLGNPDLYPAYTHSIMSHYRYADAEKFTNFGFNLFGNYTIDPIGNETQIIRRDTVVYGQRLLRNGELISLVNLDNSWNVRGFVNYGFMFKPIKCNFNIMAGTGYSATPGIVNKEIGTTKSTDIIEGLVVASNISQYIDFTISYHGNYTMSRNPIERNLNSNYWRHTIGITSTLSTKNGIVLSNSLSEQIIRGLGLGYNPDYLIWNLSIGKKIFKNKCGQISIQVNDLLDQDKDVSRTVSDYYVADNSSNTKGRYALLTFTYTIKAYSNKGNPDDKFGPPDGFDGPPPGPPPGGPPPGGPPHGDGPPSNGMIN